MQKGDGDKPKDKEATVAAREAELKEATESIKMDGEYSNDSRPVGRGHRPVSDPRRLASGWIAWPPVFLKNRPAARLATAS